MVHGDKTRQTSNIEKEMFNSILLLLLTVGCMFTNEPPLCSEFWTFPYNQNFASIL